MSELKLTKNQTLVLDVLDRGEGPLSAYSILDQLRDKGFRAPLQVYRALNKLTEQGLVHRLESLNAFVACRHKGCCGSEATVFAICESCGHVSEFSDANLAKHVNKWVHSEGFDLHKTIIELRGACQACSTAQ